MAEELFLIDDFSAETSRLGTSWEGFTDQVMGGASRMESGLVPGEQGRALRMSGQVSLKNNGGFIQMRLPLDPRKRPFDASSYTGIFLRVRGRDQGYYVHLRTPRTIFPWAYYGQSFPVSGEWTTVRLPFAAFRPQNMGGGPPDPGKLVSLAIVAYGREFNAELYVQSVGFYR